MYLLQTAPPAHIQHNVVSIVLHAASHPNNSIKSAAQAAFALHIDLKMHLVDPSNDADLHYVSEYLIENDAEHQIIIFI